MNTKILYTQSGEQFQIEKNVYGYRILQVITEQEARAVSGYYANAGDMFFGMADLGLFSKDETEALLDVANEIKQTFKTFCDYIREHHAYDG